MLNTGAERKNPTPISAVVHQMGKIKRRIIKKDFIAAGKKRLIEGLTN